MKDTIYRADAIKAVKDAYVMDAIYEVISEDIIKALSALPSAEAVQGEWIIHGEPPWVVRECSQCGTKWHHWSGGSNPNYCGHCGAKMKGGDSE